MTADAQLRRQSVEAGVRGLLGWARETRLADIPAAALRRGVMILADDLAAIVAARDEPEVRAAHGKLAALGGPAEATVFRGADETAAPKTRPRGAPRPRPDRGPRLERSLAATANGLAADWSELDEGYRRAVCHAGLYTLPALLAEAEATALPVGELLRCAVVAYEVTARFARAWTFPPLTLHPHGIFNALGAATAVGLARRLDDATLLSAVAGACTLVAVGPYDHAVRGALIRNAWPATGAWCGFRAVDWATCGIGGIAGSPYDVYTRALSGDPKPEELTVDLGEDWAVASGYHKAYGCCQYAHSAIEAALSALAELPAAVGGKHVRRVTVETHKLGMSLANYAPETTLAAKFSLPHCVASTIVYGDAGHRTFGAASLAEPRVAALRERVEMTPYLPDDQPWPRDRPARVGIELDDGRSVKRDCQSAKGQPDRPLTEAELFAKVEALAHETYPALGATLHGLLELSSERLAQPWPELLERALGR